MVLFASYILLAQANGDITERDKSQPPLVQGKHRLDLSLNSLDAEEGDVTVLQPGYTLAVGSSFRLNITASFLRGEENTGFGDTLFVFQYDPSERITASPWIPDSLGLNTTIRAPTGNADKGLGVDNWLVNVGAGWAFNPYRDLWLVPAGYYETTFSEEQGAVSDEEIGISVNFIWVFDNGIWLGYEPTIGRNFEVDDWFDDHFFIVGKIFRNGFGLGLEYGQRDRLDPISERDYYTAFLNFYYVFGILELR